MLKESSAEYIDIKVVLFINTEFRGSGHKLDYDGDQNSKIKSCGRCY